MGVRVGIDLIEVAQVEAAVADLGDRYLTRIYGEREVADCRSDSGVVDGERLAARFAAKEAVIKVLRPANGGIGWRGIQVERAESGCTSLRLKGAALASATEQRLSGWTVSLTHEAGMAAAVVVAEAS